MKNSGGLKQPILDHIRRYIEFSQITPISRGFSFDEKYLLIAKTGEKYLVRVTESDDIRVITARRHQFELIKDLRKYSPLVPDTCYFWSTDNARSCVMILTYAEGDDGEEILNTLNQESQYNAGYQAGEELKKLHGLCAPAGYPSWEILKYRKYSRYCQEFHRNPVNTGTIDLNLVDTFIKEHLYLLKGVSQTFQHDDYHPANLIFKNGQLHGIIDFNRCDWGDPIHDFYKVAYFTRNISLHFSRGQIDGYWQGKINPDFWMLYALYAAMSIVPDLVWSGGYDRRTGSHCELEKSLQRIRTVFEDHDGFTRIIPRWYCE